MAIAGSRAAVVRLTRLLEPLVDGPSTTRSVRPRCCTSCCAGHARPLRPARAGIYARRLQLTTPLRDVRACARALFLDLDAHPAPAANRSLTDRHRSTTPAARACSTLLYTQRSRRPSSSRLLALLFA